uniref:Uncharacterized protein n=1 Tax=viral metagenome TaxID=1070528 RepID=A0A6C0K599_9ZZZZ
MLVNDFLSQTQKEKFIFQPRLQLPYVLIYLKRKDKGEINRWILLYSGILRYGHGYFSFFIRDIQ